MKDLVGNQRTVENGNRTTIVPGLQNPPHHASRGSDSIRCPCHRAHVVTSLVQVFSRLLSPGQSLLAALPIADGLIAEQRKLSC